MSQLFRTPDPCQCPSFKLSAFASKMIDRGKSGLGLRRYACYTVHDRGVTYVVVSILVICRVLVCCCCEACRGVRDAWVRRSTVFSGGRCVCVCVAVCLCASCLTVFSSVPSLCSGHAASSGAAGRGQPQSQRRAEPSDMDDGRTMGTTARIRACNDQASQDRRQCDKSRNDASREEGKCDTQRPTRL